MKKNAVVLVLFLLITFVFAFNWPLDDISQENIQSYYGQKRGNSISNSIIFDNPSEIRSIGAGEVLLVMKDDFEDDTFFPSTLGTSIIIGHNDDLVSVYGNLDKSTIPDSFYTNQILMENTILGSTGNSGYQTKMSHLEFQLFDAKKNASVNPKILMPRTNNEVPLQIYDIYLENKNKVLTNINDTKSFESGIYRIYQTRNKIASPYNTTITINGVEIDKISYDTIMEENNRNYVNGKKKYTNVDIYPNDDLMMLGEVMFTPGRLSLGISIEDYLGNAKRTSYNINVY